MPKHRGSFRCRGGRELGEIKVSDKECGEKGWLVREGGGGMHGFSGNGEG